VKNPCGLKLSLKILSKKVKIKNELSPKDIMEIEKDISNIKKTAQLKEEENWDFRSFLKSLDMESEELDTIVCNLNKTVSSKIDCRECGNCCREIRPLLDQEDISKLATGLNLAVPEFKKRYLTKHIAKPFEYIFKKMPCPFLKNNQCQFYEFRPKACVHYPYLNKEGFSTRLVNVIHSCSICPVVFNVYEKLKIELQY
jgi:Fe-S-cluster containining protein